MYHLVDLTHCASTFRLQSTLSDGGSSRNTNNSSLEHMPQEVLLQVLRQVSQRDRIAGCALACKALHTAAGPATEALHLSPKTLSQQQADAAVMWLTKYSSRALCHLRLGSSDRCSSSQVAVTLPWQRLGQLTSLTLHGVTLQQADCNSSSSSSSSGSSWCGLSHLSLLQRLVLKNLGTPEEGSSNSAEYAATLGDAIGRLVQLTELSLSQSSHGCIYGSVLAGASKLSKLQCLKLASVGSEDYPVQLPDLPCSLTSLDINGVESSAAFDSGSSSSWQLPLLRQLVVADCQVPAAALLRMPQLPH
jgi:hypothetical protein